MIRHEIPAEKRAKRNKGTAKEADSFKTLTFEAISVSFCERTKKKGRQQMESFGFFLIFHFLKHRKFVRMINVLVSFKAAKFRSVNKFSITWS